MAVRLALVSALAVAHSLASEVDLPYPRSAVPTGQAGPIFVVSEHNISAQADQVTLQTLAGMLARDSPRIYTIKGESPALTPTSADDDTTVFWLHDLATHHGVQFDYTYLHSLHGLLAMFAPNVTGFVAYDPATQSTNSALIRCAAQEGVIAAGTSAMADFLSNTLNLPMLANLSSSTPLAEFQRSRRSLSDRGVVAQPDDGSKGSFMSDYAVFARMPTIEHNSNRPAATPTGFQAVLDNFDPARLNVAFGWTSSDEHAFTASVTQAGGMVHASDFLYNLALLSQLPAYQHQHRHQQVHQHPERASEAAGAATPATRTKAAAASTVAVSKKAVHTVAFINSDGDNLQLLQNDWISSAHWNHPSRGLQPSGWSYSPAMAVLMPSLLAYAARTSTSNDSLSTGPSGAGYAYPQLFPPVQRRLFAQATGQLMRQSGMSLANVIGVVPSRASVADIAAQPEVEAVVYFTFGVADQGYAGLHGNVDYVDGTPVIGLRKNLWGNGTSGDKLGVAGLVKELQGMPRDPTDPLSYSLVVNELGNSFSEVADAARMLAADGAFDVVLPEELARRLAANTKAKAQCPMPTGAWADQVGVLPKCWLPRGGASCVLQCNNLEYSLPRQTPREAANGATEAPSEVGGSPTRWWNVPRTSARGNRSSGSGDSTDDDDDDHATPNHVRCDLSVCSNLTLARVPSLHFVCADTGLPCPPG
jgi:hypothetical protein